MEIHKPKPVRSWRELLTEIGVIVLGVCIALIAEQAVQTVHEHAKAAEARASIRAEIASDLGLLNTRAASEACIAKRLDEIGALIAAYAAGKVPQETIWIGNPEAYALLDSRFKTATQSGAFSLFDGKEQAAYARFYAFFAAYFQLEVDEGKAWADLRILEDRPPSFTALEATLRSAIKQARFNRHQIQRIRYQLMNTAAGMGLVPRPVYRIPKSVCLPLHTPRAEAVALTIKDRTDRGTYDEP